ncbi:hypothetical protein Syun_025746 [Stephania yunnanensis]|uniref:DOG1 domain-containing protein n=1 Tax=Stephania yunnanensis TaxID=152371 RepID=A0AAP0HW19_9MAGN
MVKSGNSSQFLLIRNETKGHLQDQIDQYDDIEDRENQSQSSAAEIDGTTERFNRCIFFRRFNGVTAKKGQWRQEQNLRAARMANYLSVRSALDDLINEQLSRFDAHYCRSMGECRLKDLPQLLMPKCRLPLEMAAFGWFGNWRPSSILSLLRGFSTLLGNRRETALAQLIRETHVEEAVLDEEMAEIQATCILRLPFSQMPSNASFGIESNSNLRCLYSEFKKIHNVITKAQKLRYRTMELVLKKLSNQKQAAEFLVAFTGIQESTHEYAVRQTRHKGPVSVTIKELSA